MPATTAPPRVTYRPTRPNPIELILAGFADVWSRRRLTHYLVQADLAKQGANTLLGNIWWVLDPLLQMLVYVVFISVILRAGTPDYPLFVFCAILPWKWFASTVNGATGSVVARERIIKQVKFPKIVLPVSTSLGGIVHFAFGLISTAAVAGTGDLRRCRTSERERELGGCRAGHQRPADHGDWSAQSNRGPALLESRDQ